VAQQIGAPCAKSHQYINGMKDWRIEGGG